MMAQISALHAREIFDSRGLPTIEVDAVLNNGVMGRASVPAGASKGTHEAKEKRDGNPNRYGGQGVQSAIASVHEEIGPALWGQHADQQRQIDELLIALDGTCDKSRLGANALLGASLAVAKAAAVNKGQHLYESLTCSDSLRLPVPFMNMINGGMHGDNSLAVQEFMVVPAGAPSLGVALQWGVEIFHTLKGILKQKNFPTNVGDEGGFAPPLRCTVEALDLLCCAVTQAGLRLGHDVFLALDVAANELNVQGIYHLDNQSGDASFLIAFYQELQAQYPLCSIEDGLEDKDWQGWTDLTKTLGHKVQLVGDDLFVTQAQRVARGMKAQVANAVLIKPNQVGTLTETLDTVLLAHKGGYKTIMSHRSGETEDTSIVDLCIAWQCTQIKIGAPSRSDRTAKYNQLLRIEEALKHQKKDITLARPFQFIHP